MKIKRILGLALSVALLQACQQDIVQEITDKGETGTKEFVKNNANGRVGAAVSDYGTFTIQNAASNLYMEVSGDFTYNEKFNNAAKISQYGATAAGNLWQKWQSIYEKTDNGIRYYSLMNLHSGKFLDVPSGSGTNGLQLQQWQYNGSDAQLFEFREQPGGYAIINKANGLAVTNQNGSGSNGSAIVQEPFSGGEGITVYQHCAYGGYAVTLAPGSYTATQLQALGVTNNDVSSMRIPAGFQATLYSEGNFTGSSLSKSADDDCLVDDSWNDLISSIVVSGGEAGNIAFNRPVTVSSTENTNLAASNAVDGNGTTRWSSQYSDPQWIYVDLGEPHIIGRVNITWETALASNYQVQVSNNALDWTTVRNVQGNSSTNNNLTNINGTGRYVRIYGTNRATIWGYSIFELEVYDAGSAAAADPSQVFVLNALAPDSYRDDEVTRYFQRNDQSLGSVAFDQGSSIPLEWGSNAGKVLWVTQDAWDGTSLQPNNKFPCNYFFSYNNSIFIQQDKNDWTPDDPNMTINSPMGRPKQICSNQPGTDWSWPSNGVEIGNKVYMHCGEGQGLGATNQSIYVLTESAGTLWQVERTEPAGMSNQTAIGYAHGMVKANDGYVYVFGVQTLGFGYNTGVHVARFPQSNPMSWTFWNGSTWVNNPVTGAAARITEGKGTVSICQVNGKYVMISMDQGFNCDNTRNIYAATSDSPTGPFTPLTEVYKINDYMQGQYTRYYTPNVHPQYDNGRNELLMTYSVNQSACGESDCIDGYIDPNYYRIRGVRIPYSKMGL
ncbi:discoidin domain-containing protein [Fulvivirga ligni]|uniref:discoidin domain-containing protein n=1 Tax=Fulvivirga ligni TaxID=2904246 RepID=UPI001F1FACB3|nr:discoidin domain-containing protein [Fulvivirga ligni]UII19551.1 discoidin domain-containing protein [Fulvivirga ligni]